LFNLGEIHMKKSLVALAALAASAAFAQSSVTLYGIIDMGLGTVNHSPSNDPYNSYAPPVQPSSASQMLTSTTATAVPAPRLTSIMSNNTVSSRFGIKGTEDIGGGTKANFTLEAPFMPSTGAIPSNKISDFSAAATNVNLITGDGSLNGGLFSREATVGLESASAGSLKLGRQTTPMADAVGAYDPMKVGYAVSPLAYNGGYSGGGYTSEARWDSSAKYAYNLNSNTTLTAMYHSGNLTGCTSCNTGTALKAEYNTSDWGGVLAYTKTNGALNAGAGSTLGTTLALTVADTTATLLAFRVNTGAITTKFGYERIQFQNPSNAANMNLTTIPSMYGYQITGVTTTAFSAGNRVQNFYFVGANWQVSAPLELSAAVYHRDDSAYGATSAALTMTGTSKADYTSFMANYSLSKRTRVYATLNMTKVSGPAWQNAAGVTAPNLTAITTGVAHTF
jgi:predicted porin